MEQKCKQETLALALFDFFLVTQILLHCSTLPYSFVVFANPDAIACVESLTASACLVLIIAKREVPPNRFVICLIALTLGFLLVSYRATNEANIILSYLMIVMIGGISFKRLFKHFLAASVVCVVLLVALSVSGLIFNKDVVPNNRLVFSFGFTHPNRMSFVLVSIVLAYTYLLWRKREWGYSLVAAILIGGFSYFFLSSNTALIICLVVSLFIVIGHVATIEWTRTKSDIVFCICAVTIPITLAVLMLYCAALYDGGQIVFDRLNRVLHARLSYAHDYYVANEGFTLFGRPDNTITNYKTGLSFQTVDCSYCYFALVHGVIPFVLIAINGLYSLVSLRKRSDAVVIAILIAIGSIYAVMELYSMNLFTNCVILFCSVAFGASKGENLDIDSTALRNGE